MPLDEGTERVLQALPEAALVLGTNGSVVFANRVAQSRFGLARDRDDSLYALCAGPEAASVLRAFLLRCSGSRSPLPGAVELRGAAGEVSRFRCHGALLQPARNGAPARILLRLTDGGDERFSALAQRVRDLNEQIHKRRRIQALLEEALRERDLLLRELHHRVKNNIHMLSAMLSATRRETTAPEAVSVLEEASRRLAAVGAVHQLLYLGDNLRGVRGDEFVARIGTMVMAGAGARERLVLTAEPIEIPNDAAVPLALILNELVANALKHGIRPDGTPGRVHLGLRDTGESAIEVWVEDEGAGFPSGDMEVRRASGLGLVRGLARQIGGAFIIGRGAAGGARCAVRFQDRHRMTADQGPDSGPEEAPTGMHQA